MKKFFLVIFAVVCILSISFAQEKKLLTPEILWSFGRIGEVSVSPDNSTVLFSVRYYDIQKNKGQSDIYTVPANGGDYIRLTNSPDAKYSIQWRPDGKKIGFVCTKSGTTQIWEMSPDGSDWKQISNIEGGINDFKYSPDMKKILFTKDVKIDKDIHDIYPDLQKTNARIYNDLMYRHWDTWADGTYSHLFVADYSDNIKTALDIMQGEPYETPMKPFGGMEQINWSPDSKQIAYTCKKMTGKQYSISTNSEIYIHNIDSKITKNITEGMMGYDVAPVFSPDGKKIAWCSMERDGYEADKNRLFILDFESGTKTYATKDLDQNAEGLNWTKDSKTIYFVSGVRGTQEIFKYNLLEGKITRVTDEQHNYLSAIPAGNKLISEKHSMQKPTEIYAVDTASGKDIELSFVNKNILDNLAIGDVKRRITKATDGKDLNSWVIYPPNFDPNKKYPTLLFCEGGPQSAVDQFWSYRWNFQIMAANGYIIIAPARRGSLTYGQEWVEQISGDYGGQNMRDYLSAIDDIATEPYVNKDKLGCVGASYGGYSVYYLAGIHEKRFKAFISHDGIFNEEAQYLETEEMWFEDWDMGGPFWDKDNAVAQKSFTYSPHKLVQNWDTPILCIHGEKDYRIVYTQAMQAFNAAILRGIPAQLLIFPDENHWVLQPQNGIVWQRTFFGWLDRWLK
ncbi:MAG: S9 family peptidase [Ignavibacteriae bacterium]|nr:S9 family peptidase [Ignavibacteriota bacterium]